MVALGIRAAAAKSCPVSPAGRHFYEKDLCILCAHDRKVVLIWQSISDPWHVTEMEIGRQFEEESREKGVDRGNDGLARRVCFCLGLRVLVFLLFLEQRCSLKSTRASISALFQYFAYLLDFFSLNILPTRLCRSLSKYCLPA